VPILDRIFLDDLHIDCIVGVLEREQHTPQPLHLRIALELDLTLAGDTGVLGASVNYAHVDDQVRFLAQHGRFRLIESLGLAALRLILAPPSPTEDRAAVQRASIELRKPAVLGGNPVPGVALTRAAPVPTEVTEAAGVRVHVLVAVPDSVAWRVELAPGSRWTAPPGVAGLCISGEIAHSSGTLRAGDRAPRPLGTLTSGSGSTLLVVGQP
jgi:dihydroneopterin aldolase